MIRDRKLFASNDLFKELIKSSPYAIIELFEIELNPDIHGQSNTSDNIYRFHSGCNAKTAKGDVVWRGKTYSALPITMEGFEYNGKTLPRPTLTISNLLGNISGILLSVNEVTVGNDLTGAQVTRIRTLAKYLDAVNFDSNTLPTGYLPAPEELPREIYYIDRKSVENREIVQFELASSLDLAGVKVPSRNTVANLCPWVYKSSECGYTGTNYFDENDDPIAATAATNISTTGYSHQITSGNNIISNGVNAIVSTNGWYMLRVNKGGNVVVYRKPGFIDGEGNASLNSTDTGTNSRIFSTNTQRGESNGPFKLTMDTSGALILTDGSNSEIWRTQTANMGTVTTIQNDGWFPPDLTDVDDNPIYGRAGAFGYELLGAATASSTSPSEVTKTFKKCTDSNSDYFGWWVPSTTSTDFDNTRSISIKFTGYIRPLTDHYSGQTYRWGAADGSPMGVTFVSSGSSGDFNKNENIVIALPFDEDSNPFSNNSFELLKGDLNDKPSLGATIRITATNIGSGNFAEISTTGTFTVKNSSGNVLFTSGYTNSVEPLVKTGTADPLKDVCGKRLTSCEKRFPSGDANGGLPFGSFPAMNEYEL